ncbi:MAG: hypothetical protein ACLSAC_06255 [Enterocloster bolteae]
MPDAVGKPHSIREEESSDKSVYEAGRLRQLFSEEDSEESALEAGCCPTVARAADGPSKELVSEQFGRCPGSWLILRLLLDEGEATALEKKKVVRRVEVVHFLEDGVYDRVWLLQAMEICEMQKPYQHQSYFCDCIFVSLNELHEERWIFVVDGLHFVVLPLFFGFCSLSRRSRYCRCYLCNRQREVKA